MIRTKIIYIGNKLSKYGIVPTSVETLGKQLEEYYTVVSASDKWNKVARMFDMLMTILKNRSRSSCVIIDTYSTSNFYFAVIAALLCRLLRIKYIPILRGGNLPERLDKSRLLSKMMFCHSYINVAPSGYLKYEFERQGYKTVLIPNNIDICDYDFKERATFKPRLLWVRSFVELYNPKMAVNVLKTLKTKYSEAKLCMLGPDKDGSMGSTMDWAKSLGLSVSKDANSDADLIVPGKMSKEDWRKLSTDYDIFINTTNFDNTPVSVIEGMALGLLVVSTNVGGVPYLIDDKTDGLLVNPDDTNGMVKCIESIVDERVNGLEIANKAREKVESFDWDVVKIKWQKLIEGIDNNSVYI